MAFRGRTGFWTSWGCICLWSCHSNSPLPSNGYWLPNVNFSIICKDKSERLAFLYACEGKIQTYQLQMWLGVGDSMTRTFTLLTSTHHFFQWMHHPAINGPQHSTCPNMTRLQLLKKSSYLASDSPQMTTCTGWRETNYPSLLGPFSTGHLQSGRQKCVNNDFVVAGAGQNFLALASKDWSYWKSTMWVFYLNSKQDVCLVNRLVGFRIGGQTYVFTSRLEGQLRQENFEVWISPSSVEMKCL